jgi:hypothetical protein
MAGRDLLRAPSFSPSMRLDHSYPATELPHAHNALDASSLLRNSTFLTVLQFQDRSSTTQSPLARLLLAIRSKCYIR